MNQPDITERVEETNLQVVPEVSRIDASITAGEVADIALLPPDDQRRVYKTLFEENRYLRRRNRELQDYLRQQREVFYSNFYVVRHF